MNVIVANKYKDLFLSANIQTMKVMNGVFKFSELINSFKDMYYQKLIIDATALEGFPKQEILKQLASNFDTEKLILFLPPDNSPPKSFLSFLVSINIYNFTDNVKGILQLINRSNSYEDVVGFVVKNDDINVAKNVEAENFDFHTYDGGRVILGIKSVTKDEYSTRLIYMIKTQLEKKYQKRVLAVEIEQKNFLYYNDPNMHSISKNKIGEFFSNSQNYDVLLVNLGPNDSESICDDVIYLINPSIYYINQLMFVNKSIFEKLKGKKIVLNDSLLTEKDINVFSSEAGISIYFNLPPLNDRIYNQNLDDLLYKLGMIEKNVETNTKRGLFDFFK